MDETTNAEYAKQLRELLRNLLAPTPVGEGPFGDWNGLRASRRERRGGRAAARRWLALP